MIKRKNVLEASAQRLGLDARFEKLAEASGQEPGWYMVALDGIQRRTWLGLTLQEALVELESRFDHEAYLH